MYKRESHRVIWVAFLTISIICSCNSSTNKTSLKPNPSLPESSATKLVDSISYQRSFIDSSTLFTLLLNRSDSTAEILKNMGDYPTAIFEFENTLTLKWYQENFDNNPGKELILHFSSSSNLDMIYILTQNDRRYKISPYFEWGQEGSYNEQPILDFKNQFILVKSRMWGTCTGGYCWEVFKFKDNDFKHILSFAGDHSNGSCGDEDTSEYYKVSTTYNILSKDSIVIKAKVGYETYSFNDKTEKRTAFSTDHYNVRMSYIYNSKLDTFDLINSKGEKLNENPIWAESFWDLIQDKKL